MASLHAGESFVEQRALSKRMILNATLTLDGAGNITAAAIDGIDGLPATSADFVVANGAGTLCPEYTFANLILNGTTLNIVGLEILDGTATKFHGALGIVTATSTSNAAIGVDVFARSAAPAANAPGGAITSKGHVVVNLGFIGTVAGTGLSLKLTFQVEWE